MPNVNETATIAEAVALSIASSNPIVLSYTFSDGESINLGTKIMQNFTDVRALINGNIQGENFSSAASLHVAYTTVATKVVTPEIRALSDSHITVDIGSILGSGVRVLNSDSDILFEIDSEGTIWIGKAAIEPFESVAIAEEVTLWVGPHAFASDSISIAEDITVSVGA